MQKAKGKFARNQLWGDVIKQGCQSSQVAPRKLRMHVLVKKTPGNRIGMKEQQANGKKKPETPTREGKMWLVCLSHRRFPGIQFAYNEYLLIPNNCKTT